MFLEYVHRTAQRILKPLLVTLIPLAADGLVVKGDKVVTSNISDKYLPGLLIGYIDDVQNDANNLTKSGTISVATDFDHLSVVLVITDLKDYDYE